MAEIQTEEGWHIVEDGTKLYTKTWKPNEPPKARVLVVHGFSDHCNAYFNFFPALARRGIQVHSFDQRGWGRSSPSASTRGATGPTSLVLSDIISILTSLLAKDQSVPLFLLGHSMGGGEILTFLALGPSNVTSRIRGYLAEAPFISLAPSSKPWRATVLAGRMAAKLLPKMQLHRPLDPMQLSRSEEVRKAYAEDELCHDVGTLEGLAGTLDRGVGLESGKVRVTGGRGEGGKTRLWVGHGTIDGACDYGATRAWFDRWLDDVEDKELRTYEGWSHKLHAEPGEDADTFANDVAEWILARSGDLASIHTRVEKRQSKL